jgi:prepilin-type N-terminal cleavage/methylation domain-containing protein
MGSGVEPLAVRNRTLLLRQDQTRGGFTLLEVVIALGILTFGLLAVAAMQLYGLRGGRTGKHMTQAMTIAQDRMEIFQRVAFVDMAPTGGWSAVTAIDETVEAASGTREEESYGVDWRISDDVVGWTKIIDVRVSWNEPEMPNRRVVLTSRRYNW